jgi:hypothetical protein
VTGASLFWALLVHFEKEKKGPSCQSQERLKTEDFLQNAKHRSVAFMIRWDGQPITGHA